MPLKWFKKRKKEEKELDTEKEIKEFQNEVKKRGIEEKSSFSNIFLKKNFEILPIISEKTRSLINRENVYVFKIKPVTINRTEIKKAIENLFKVNVESIRTAIYKKRIRGRTRIPSVRNKFKKVFVKLKEGEKIDIFE
ncbi:MAG: 50S ribosomal protein L23 [Patescibacteria group bacterium]|nr:50S ribosomal protein L23 [Patescibacteria group bacterium]